MNVLRREDGQTTVMFAAIMGIVALGFLAFALDIGTLFRQKRMAQAAADAVAVAAAAEVANNTSANEQTVAKAVAKLNGFDTTLATNPATVALSTPTTGNFTGTYYTKAVVSKPVSTLFLGAFSSSFANMTVSASATGGGSQSSQTCVCLEGQTGQTLDLNNGSTLSAPNCGVVVDSSSSNAITLYGGATVNAQTLGTVSSTWNTSGNVYGGGNVTASTITIQGISTQCAPTMPTPPTYSNCLTDPGGGSSAFTAGPASASGVICYKGLTIGTNGAVPTLNPGTYVISQGYLHFATGNGTHTNLGGNGIFFYLTGSAALQIDNGANINLVAGGNTESGGATAPTVGIYNGILLYQDTNDTSSMTIDGGGSAYLNGALYAPSAAMYVGDGGGTTIKGGVVANSLTMNGGGTLNATPGTNEGSLSYAASPKLVQ